MAAVDILGVIPKRTNYSKDPQATRTAWWIPTTGAVATDTTRVYSQTSNIKYTASGSVAIDGLMLSTPPWNGTTPNDAIPVVAGDSVSAQVRVSTDLASKSLYLRLRFWTVAGVEVTAGGPWVGSTVALVAGATVWNLLDVHGIIVPATAVFVTVNVYAGSTFASTNVLYFDGQDVAKNEQIVTFVAGDLGTLYAWNGTAQQSTSYRSAENPRGITGVGGSVMVSTKVFAADMRGNEYAELTDYVIGGSIDHDIDRDFKGSCSLTVTDTTLFNAFQWVKIYQLVESETGSDEDGLHVVGLFRLSQPAATFMKAIGTVSGLDATIQLNDTTTLTTYNVAAGTKYTDAVRALITAAGFGTRYVIPDAAAVVPVGGWSWIRGTSYLRIINDLLGAVGYYTLYTMPDGTFASMPYLERSSVNPAHSFTIGQDAVIVGDIDESVNDDDLYNYVTVTRTINDHTTQVRSAENKNPAHAYSTVALGLLADPTGATKVYRVKTVAFDDAESTTAMQALAREVLALASMLRYVTVQVMPHPSHVPHEIIELDFDGTTAESLSGRYYVDSSSFGLVGSAGTMTIKMRRIESYD